MSENVRQQQSFTPWKVILFMALWNLAFVGPKLIEGPNVVTLTYLEGAQRIWSEVSPYSAPSESTDSFLYSPFFAMVYGIFLHVPTWAHALLWGFINALIFWWGIFSWSSIPQKSEWFAWLGLAVCSMDLDISLRYQQINALIAGIVLLGLAAYRDKHFKHSASLLTFAANIKILPLVFLLGLAYPVRRRFILASAMTWVVLVISPCLAYGLKGFQLSLDHLNFIRAESDSRHIVDLTSALWRLGWGDTGKYLAGVMALLTPILFIGYRLRRHQSDHFQFCAWYIFGMCALLALSPRTESPTFVWAAPGFLFFAREKIWIRIPLVLAMFLMTIIYTSIWTPFFHTSLSNEYSSKALGSGLLWLISGAILFRKTFPSMEMQ